MTIAARQTQRQQQALKSRIIQAVGILRLTNAGLAEYLERRASANPLLRLRLPAGVAIAGHDETLAGEGGLYDHLHPQLGMILSTPRDRRIAMAFVEALQPCGWLDRPVSEIARHAAVPLAEAEAVLTRLQQGIEPTGLFARDLADCLRLQAAERGLLSPVLLALIDGLALLAEGGPKAVARATGHPVETVAEAARQLRRLDPRPGLAFETATTPLRTPDIIVSRRGEAWQVELNRATLPALAISGAAPPALRSVRDDAEWLLRAVERRNRTILAVARLVMQRQRQFLDHGPSALVALKRTDIASDLGLHDSTVGRVAHELLVETPHGLRTLCSFFDRGVPNSGAAAAAIRHRIAQIVAAEDRAAPRSDAELAAALSGEGMALARRTVAKFRAELGIPPRSQRRARAA